MHCRQSCCRYNLCTWSYVIHGDRKWHLLRRYFFLHWWLSCGIFRDKNGHQKQRSNQYSCSIFAKISKVVRLFYMTISIYTRSFRLTPAYAFSILLMVSLYRFMGSGPYFDQVSQQLYEQCKDTWWAQLVYIGNMYPPGNYVKCVFIGAGLCANIIIFSAFHGDGICNAICSFISWLHLFWWFSTGNRKLYKKMFCHLYLFFRSKAFGYFIVVFFTLANMAIVGSLVGAYNITDNLHISMLSGTM